MDAKGSYFQERSKRARVKTFWEGQAVNAAADLPLRGDSGLVSGGIVIPEGLVGTVREVRKTEKHRVRVLVAWHFGPHVTLDGLVSEWSVR